jgi:2,3-dimethylmalate lyase
MSDLLRSPSPGPARLRQLLAAGDGPVVLPGVYDALGARLVEQAGFDGVYMTGFGTSAGLLGRPDVGLLGMSEMVDNARRIVAATDLPVLADADTGYGNPVNVIRTVQEYERSGVAGIHLEDQVMPKRCGHLAGKSVVPASEFRARVEAAVAARRDPDFLLVARTDARGPLGLDAALERAELARRAGADMVFVEALRTEAELESVAEALRGTPLLLNWVEGGRTPPLPLERIAELGFALVILPLSTLLAATRAMVDVLGEIRRAGTPLPVLDRLTGFDEFGELIGLPEIDELGSRFEA